MEIEVKLIVTEQGILCAQTPDGVLHLLRADGNGVLYAEDFDE